MKSGILFIVATPIGNLEDITLRALSVLKEADAVICEEYRAGSTLLKKIGIEAKEIILLNEHNEKEEAQVVAKEMAQGKSYALISDCGTPVFADPGTALIRWCNQMGVIVVPVPGPSSLMAAISLSPLPLDEFHFAGFLPRKQDIRRKKLAHLKQLRVPVILMDAPYRLGKLLSETAAAFGKGTPATVAFDLTLPGEKIIHASLGEILKTMKDKKGEFILIIHNNN